MKKIINRETGETIVEDENLAIRELVESAVKDGVDLAYAYLRGADLRGAFLKGAYLRGAYLRGAYLEGAYLRGADLRGADLRFGYLKGADLRGADLRGADFEGVRLLITDIEEIKINQDQVDDLLKALGVEII